MKKNKKNQIEVQINSTLENNNLNPLLEALIRAIGEEELIKLLQQSNETKSQN